MTNMYQQILWQSIRQLMKYFVPKDRPTAMAAGEMLIKVSKYCSFTGHESGINLGITSGFEILDPIFLYFYVKVTSGENNCCHQSSIQVASGSLQTNYNVTKWDN